MNFDETHNVFDIKDRREVERAPELRTFKTEDEAAVFILQLLKQSKFNAAQLFDSKRLIRKWCAHYSFKSLVMDLSMSLDSAEDYFYLTFELPVNTGA